VSCRCLCSRHCEVTRDYHTDVTVVSIQVKEASEYNNVTEYPLSRTVAIVRTHNTCLHSSDKLYYSSYCRLAHSQSRLHYLFISHSFTLQITQLHFPRLGEAVNQTTRFTLSTDTPSRALSLLRRYGTLIVSAAISRSTSWLSRGQIGSRKASFLAYMTRNGGLD
jgi:hypothetical protein